MKLTNKSKVAGFKVTDIADAPDENGTAYLFEHIKTQARLLYLENEDNNKAFAIGFKTPPSDDTGVFHILEHSVLQGGSKRFPIKDPFTELRKTSMLTFINACTGQDSTFYPVSSTNEQDLLNLMQVYLDAVYYPNIYEDPAIFLQEGRHFELSKDGKTLSCNGVVYNEMKGALKDPFATLFNKVNEVLFPQSPLHYVSGGKPDSIQDLTFENFIEAHKNHYFPVNSFMFLYGNLDIDKFLFFIDENYLKNLGKESYSKTLTPNEYPLQQAVQAKNVECYFEIEKNQGIACIAFVLNNLSYQEKIAMEILTSALGANKNSPLQKCLLEADLAHEVNVFFSAQKQSIFYIICEGVYKNTKKDLYLSTIQKEFKKLAEEGISEDFLNAAISSAIISVRMGSPEPNDGFRIVLENIAQWLNCKDNPVTYFNDGQILLDLKNKIPQTYFEDLLKKSLLSTKHFASVFLYSGTDTSEIETNLKLETMAHDLKEEDICKIQKESELLFEFQSKENTQNDLKCLPKVKVSDLNKEGRKFEFSILKQDNNSYIYHTINTREMIYLKRFFDISHCNQQEMVYLGFYASLLGKLATKKHSSRDLDLFKGECFADCSFTISPGKSFQKGNYNALNFIEKSIVPQEKLQCLIDIPNEIIYETIFDEKEKITQILLTQKSDTRLDFINNPLSFLRTKSFSYYLKTAACAVQNILDPYIYLNNFDFSDTKALDNLIEHISRQGILLQNTNNIITSFAGEKDFFEKYIKTDNTSKNTTGYKSSNKNSSDIFENISLSDQNEVFLIPSDVSYICASCKIDFENAQDYGIWKVVSKILSLDYLWKEVRIKNGAYGASFSVNYDGIATFSAFRTPTIDKTIQIFEEAGKWLTNCNLNSSELEGYIIRAISEIDRPLKSLGLIDSNLFAIKNELTNHKNALIREAILNATEDDIHERGYKLLEASDNLKIAIATNRDLLNASKREFTINEIFE